MRPNYTADDKSLWMRLVSKIEVLANGCWHWRGATGKRQRKGKTGRLSVGSPSKAFVQPHRQMLIFARGEPPTPTHHACHDCPNGDELCCNPTHLYWGTQSENEYDKRPEPDIEDVEDVPEEDQIPF